jgi:succinoglycan biosynthesis protein ExoL
LRCAKSFTLLEQLAQKLGPLVEIDLWGVVAEDQIPDAAARMAALANLRFHGRYKASDLSLIYGGAHFVWAIDYYEAGGNSDWLLPNRLYEGLAHGVVPIAVEGVETARWLERHCVGRVLVAPLDKTLEHFVRTLSIESYTHMRAAVDALPPSAVRFTSADARALVDALSGVAMSNSAAAPVTA